MSVRVTAIVEKRRSSSWRMAVLPAMILGVLAPRLHAEPVAAAGPASPVDASPAIFDTSFFPSGSAPQVDMSRFEKSGYVAPGTYRGDVLLNKEWRAHTDIVFVDMPGGGNSQPCYNATVLANYGIDLGKVAADTIHPDRKPIPTGTFCGELGDYIPGATASFDTGEQTLSLTVPQIYVQHSARGYVPPSQWDAGINAGLLGYAANFYRSDNNSRTRSSGYLGLNASLNFGSWHVAHLGAMNWSQGAGKHYQNSATYLQHDLPGWRSQLVVGDAFTSGEFFDSVRLRGVSLYSDDRMLPQSLQGYAPVVRGVAQTNAQVVIRQNGYIIYDTHVAPGPFVIDDLYPTGYGGDIDVEIREADGRVRRFTQPFSAVPQLLRPGQDRWSVAAGKITQQNLIDSPSIVQATYQRGLSNRFTGYGGIVLSGGYRSILAGTAINTGVGAFSADITHAANNIPGQSASQGYSLRLGYNKNILDTGTNIGIAAYRYSTHGFVGLDDAVLMRDAIARGEPNGIQRERRRLDLTLNQSLGDRYGQIYLNGSLRDYWNGARRQVDFTAGYSNNWKSATYSFSVQRTRDSLGPLAGGIGMVDQIPGQTDGDFPPSLGSTRRDTRFFFNLSMPLGRAAKSPTLSAMANRANGANNGQVSINGNLDDARRIAYGATLGHADGGNTLALNGQYNGRRTDLSGSYSQGAGYRQFGAGAMGSVLVHAGGVTFSEPAGDTVGLVYAPGATGARVENSSNATVDKRGYALVPNLTPYQLNTVTLDPKGAAENVELKDTAQNVVPRVRSVVRLRYEADSSRMMLVDTQLPDGRPVPFGAEVEDDQGHSAGVVGQASRLIVRGTRIGGTYTVRWGSGAGERCTVHIEVSTQDKSGSSGVEVRQAPCIVPSMDGSAVHELPGKSQVLNGVAHPGSDASGVSPEG